MLEAFVVCVLDDGQMLGHVQHVGRDLYALLRQRGRRPCKRALDISAACAHERGLSERRMRRRVISDLAERAALLDGVAHEERIECAPACVRHCDGRVNVVGAHDFERELCARRRLNERLRVRLEKDRLRHL